MNKKEIGKKGEDLALAHYEKRGYRCLFRNWRLRGGELDLILQKGLDLVFVEVKTRATPIGGWGENAVDRRKKQTISQLIKNFVWLNPEYEKYYPRFDIMVVETFTDTINYLCYENCPLE